MSAIAPALDALSADIAAASAEIGRRVDVAALGITDRDGELPLGPPGRTVSPNGACRLVRAADGWIAVNLAREEDHDLIPAWLGCDFGVDPWAAIEARAPRRGVADLVGGATLLGLPVSAVGEARADGLDVPTIPAGAPRSRRDGRLRVVDLSALWAGPLCGAVLHAAGAAVLRVESKGRPDPSRHTTPGLFRRLNEWKAELPLDLGTPAGRAGLQDLIAAADVLVTSLRPRGLASLGLAQAAIFAANPSLTWVAITGHGWMGAGAARVAFGDDAAAAGGLVDWTAGEPGFLGDALADPVTGLAAAAGALRAVAAGGGVIVDAAMARSAAGAAAVCGLRAAA